MHQGIIIMRTVINFTLIVKKFDTLTIMNKWQKPSSLNEQGNVVASVVYVIISAIMLILAFRLLFSILGANPANPIANFVYSTSAPLVAPFFGLFTRQPQLGIAGFEFETLIAIVVYGAIAAIFARIATPRR